MGSKIIIGVFDDYIHAGSAVEGLKNSGVEDGAIALLRKDRSGSPQSGVLTASDRPPDEYMTRFGIIGSVCGFLIGLSLIYVPGLGALAIAAPLIAAVSGAAAGGALGVITGALINFDVPPHISQAYEQHLSEGKVLVTMNVTNFEERVKIEQVMEQFGAVEVDTKAA